MDSAVMSGQRPPSVASDSPWTNKKTPQRAWCAGHLSTAGSMTQVPGQGDQGGFNMSPFTFARTELRSAQLQARLNIRCT